MIGRAVWSGWRAAGVLAAPLAAPYLRRRLARGKEEAGRTDEKRGIPSAPAFGDAPVWVHGVSVGESVVALTVAERLVAEGVPVVLTTATPTAARRVSGAVSDRLVHQYAPLDAPPFVSRFIGHWRPRAALFVEAEVWPATLHALASTGVPRAHVNARLSDRSFRRWAARPWLARPLFGLIDLALAQSAEQAERFRTLGTPRAEATGNIKFDAPPPPADTAALAALRESLGRRRLFLAASTHEGEEAVIIDAHRRIAALRPDVVTIIAPRHPERGAEVARLAGGAPRRSLGEAPGPITVADTLGELGTLFAAASVTFLGGSLVPVGGHNPAEPAAHGTALLTGPHHGAMFEPFITADAARLVDGVETLATAATALLANPAEATAMAERARAVLAAERGALERTMAALEPLLRRA